MLNKDIAVLDFDALVSMLDGNGACRFVSLLYRAKPNAKVAKLPNAKGELARHTIMLNVNRERLLRQDRATLLAKRPSLKGVDAQACDELVASLTETLETGSNCRYTKQGYYQGQGNGNVQVSVEKVAYVRGYSLKKQVIEAGTPFPPTKSADKTIAKDNLRKLLKNTRCREFCITLENFVMAKVDGKALVIDATGSSLRKLAQAEPVTLAVPATSLSV